MATIKVPTVIQSCPKCGKRLMKGTPGTVAVGSPLLTCRKCGTTSRTDLRQEWCFCQSKWQVFLMPMIMALAPLLMVPFIDDPAVLVFAELFLFLPIAAVLLLLQLVRIMLSIRRMKNPEYIRKLCRYGVISETDCSLLLNSLK